MNLTMREKETLDGILRTEIMELKDLIETADSNDRTELQNELKVVESIFTKLNN